MSLKLMINRISLLFLLLFTGSMLFGQEEEIDFDDLLQRIDTVENPVYKPVISLGYGVLNFIGDVKGSSRYPVLGNPAAKANISTFIDNKHFIRANFFYLTGVMTGSQRSYTDITRNLNFSSRINMVGATASYEFGHLINENIPFRPYFSFGVALINFDTKGDLKDSNGNFYNYWTDGTIRSIAEDSKGMAFPLNRDYIYETDLRRYEEETYGLGNYNRSTASLPVEVGFVLKVSQRIFLNVSSQFHYTFTDYIDNVSSHNSTHIEGDKMKDAFLVTSFSLHFDMFSEPKIRVTELLYADVDLDPIFYDDEDGDFILDVADHCPGTPYGVMTDTLGCPLDHDQDGVPDYLDKEMNTPEGEWVDDEGKTLTEDDFLTSLQRDSALNREDLDAYLESTESTYQPMQITEIPEKFVPFDTDEDGYISFDELLKVIDDFFDFKVDITLDELHEVNDFFFSQ